MKRELGVSLMDALLRLGPGFNEIDALARQIEDPAERRSFLRKLAEGMCVMGYVTRHADRQAISGY